MTTTTSGPTRPLTAHAACSHPVSKAARAKCRKERGKEYANAMVARASAKPVEKPRVIETCHCKGKPSGFRALGDVWVCADCDRPTAAYAFNVLLADVA